MWGRDMLIAPVFQKGISSREVYLPQGDWYDWWTNKKEKGGKTVYRDVDLATMPIYVRAGAIIPFDPIRQYTAEEVTEPATLKIYSGADGKYTLYEDDGVSLDYLDEGGNLTYMSWDDTQGKRIIILALSSCNHCPRLPLAFSPLPLAFRFFRSLGGLAQFY